MTTNRVALLLAMSLLSSIAACKKEEKKGARLMKMSFTCSDDDKQCKQMMANMLKVSGGPRVFTIAAVELASDTTVTAQDIDEFCRTNNWMRRLPSGDSGDVFVLHTPYDVKESTSRAGLEKVLCPDDSATFYYYEDYQIRFSSFEGKRNCSKPTTDAGTEQ